MEKTIKPRLLFFKFRNDNTLSNVASFFLQDSTRCLSEFFEVILINEDCDYQQICEIYKPNLALFESGINHKSCHKIDIRNTHTCSEVLKIGLHHGDSWCEARAGLFSDLEHWGIETFFSVSTTIAELTPEIFDNVFVWPNFIDPKMCRDYGQPKNIPIMFNGKIHSLYPWREKIQKIITQYYPSLVCPHPDYIVNLGNPHQVYTIYGEQYGRTINASWFVPTCGTVANEIVRKHFEIPGNKSCLITERTPIVEAAGFSDMKNCVFADDTDVLDKLDYLFKNLDELEKITDAGYQLVHSRHTLKHRDQIFQWFNLQKNLKANQKIIQSGPFEPLSIVEESSGNKSNHIICDGLIIQLLRKGDEKLWACQYKEAQAFYTQASTHIWWMPEPKLRIALCNLYTGKPAQALHWLLQPIRYTLEEYRAIDPDPVEWAYLIIALLCRGKLKKAIKCADQFPSLCHLELNRVRLVVDIMKNEIDKNTTVNGKPIRSRYSVHQLPERSFDEWLDQLGVMLKACKQFRLARILKNTALLKYDPSTQNNVLADEKCLQNRSNNSFAQPPSPIPSEDLSLILEMIESENMHLGRRIKKQSKKVIKNYIIVPLNFYFSKLLSRF